jgi:CIC family chloride channel protein
MFNLTAEDFALVRIPMYILLGVMCGFVSLYYTRGMNKVEEGFRKLNSFWKKLIVGSLVLSALIYLLPPLYGEGYSSINHLLSLQPEKLLENSLFFDYRHNEYFVLAYLALIVIFKLVATAATNGAGGVGGLFAPSLFVGCIVGYMCALALQLCGVNVPAHNFALAGMAGVMSGIMHAPLTGIFLIAELSGGYELFMPLMIVSVMSFITIYLFEPHSIYAMRLAKKGELVTHHKDRAVLCLMKTQNVIETDLQQISPDATLGDLVKLISTSKRNIFPVVKSDGVFIGVVSLEEVRNIMFRPELYNRFNVKKLMIYPPARVDINESMDSVMEKFEQTQAWNLPVLDGDKYVGYVSKSKIFNVYREVLVEFSDD